MTPFQHFKLSVQKKEAKKLYKGYSFTLHFNSVHDQGERINLWRVLYAPCCFSHTGNWYNDQQWFFFSVLSYPALSNHRETCWVLIPNYNQIEPQLPHCALSEILSWPCINFAHHLMWSHQDFRQCRDLDLFTDHTQLQTTNHLWKHQALLSPVHIPKHKSLTDLSCWYRKS